MRRLVVLIFVLFLISPCLQAELYKAMTVQAAPGRLLDLIQLYQDHRPFYALAGDEAPFWMRHSQGAKWDLLMLFPMGSFESYYTPEREKKRQEAFRKRGLTSKQFADMFYERVAWHEEVFVEGPPLSEVRERFSGAGFFHVEMFIGLAGKREALLEQRKMENVYLRNLGRTENLIFTHEQGAAWDLFTVGFYKDIRDYAAAGDQPLERRDDAARKAGFKSAGDLSPYLRNLIASHQDTLAVAIP